MIAGMPLARSASRQQARLSSPPECPACSANAVEQMMLNAFTINCMILHGMLRKPAELARLKLFSVNDVSLYSRGLGAGAEECI